MLDDVDSRLDRPLDVECLRVAADLETEGVRFVNGRFQFITAEMASYLDEVRARLNCSRTACRNWSGPSATRVPTGTRGPASRPSAECPPFTVMKAPAAKMRGAGAGYRRPRP